MDSFYATILCTLIVIFYSAFGGIRSVTFTDVIQLITFGVLIPVLALVIWETFGSFELIANVFETNPAFDHNKLLNYKKYDFWIMLVLFLYYLIPSLNPTFFQRTLIAKDTTQAKHAFAIASAICFLIYCLSSFIGLMTLAYKPGLDSNEVLTFAIDHFSYPIMKSFILIGIVAMVMSTADSWLNSGSVIFAHDICKPLGINADELILSRLFTIFIGVGTIILTLYTNSLLEIVLIGANFYMPIVTVPLMLGLFRFRTTGKVVLITMALSMTVVVIWRYKVQPVTGIDSVIPGLITSLVSIFLIHHILGEPGGWEGNKNSNSKKKVVKPSIKEKIIKSRQCIDKIKNKIANFNLFEFANNYKPKSDITYTYFAFAVLLTIITTLSIKRAVYKEYPYLITFLQAIIFCIATSFLCNKLWPKKFKDKYIGIIWYISLFVGLTVISSLLVLLSKFSHVSLTILTIHLIIIPLLVGWRTALIMIPVGLWLAFSLYKTSIGVMVPGEINDLKLKLMYILFIVAGFALTFLKDQQYQQEETEKKVVYLEKEADFAKRELENVVQGLDFLENQFNDKEGKLKAKEIYLKDQLKLRNIEISKLRDLKDEFIRNIPHETNTPMTGILSLSEVLYSCYDSLDEKLVKQSIKDIVSSSDRLKSFVSNIADLSKLSALTYELNKTKVDLSELARERPVLYKKIFADDARQEFIFKVEDNIIVHCDEYYITQAIDNLISNAVKYGESQPITISLTKTVDNKVQFKISDQGIGIPQDELIGIFNKFTVSSKTRTPAGGRGVGLALCEKVISVHGGSVEATSDGKKGSEFSFVLPL